MGWRRSSRRPLRASAGVSVGVVWGTIDSDTVMVTRNLRDDTIYGRGGIDTINGLLNNDLILQVLSNDVVQGLGNDALRQ